LALQLIYDGSTKFSTTPSLILSAKPDAPASITINWDAPSLPPGQYFRIMMIGFFEGLDSERGIAWRLRFAHSAAVPFDWARREDTGSRYDLAHATLIDAENPSGHLQLVLERLAQAGLIKGKTIGVDSSTLEANAAKKSIVRRDMGGSYMAYLQRLAEAEGIDDRDTASLLRMDRKA